jgi:hypothetical protein
MKATTEICLIHAELCETQAAMSRELSGQMFFTTLAEAWRELAEGREREGHFRNSVAELRQRGWAGTARDTLP